MRQPYRGTRRDNVPVHGWTTEDPVTFTENKYRAGWRTLELLDPTEHRTVGSITAHPDTGHRTWWAEDVDS